MSRPNRTDTGFFILIVALTLGAVVWASRSPSDVLPVATTPIASGQEAATAPTNREQPRPWSRDLLVVRDGRAIVELGVDGSERFLYQAPDQLSITSVSPVTDGQLSVRLSGSDGAAVRFEVVTVATGATTVAGYRPSDLWAPRPGGPDRAEARFSNAERDFGSIVELIHGDVRSTLWHTTAPVSVLAWRADGEVLAVAAQHELLLVQLSAGDSRAIQLPGAIQSLSWRSGSVVLLTTDGAYQLDASAPGLPTKLALSGTISRDLVAIGEQQYAWLAGSGTAATLVVQTLGTNPVVTIISASQLIGGIP